jgi:hypothetical protein
VENSHLNDEPSPGDIDALGDLTPRPEALARLYELCDRYQPAERLRSEHGAHGDHFREHGHLLRFGCCRQSDDEASGLLGAA